MTKFKEENMAEKVGYLHNQAVASHKEGKLEEAISFYLESIEIDENQPAWIYGNVITLLAQVGRLDEGLKLGKNAETLYPESDELYRGIGLLYHQSGNIKSTVDYYLKALELKNQQPDWVYSQCLENLIKLKNYNLGISIGEQGCNLYNDSMWINYHLAELYILTENWEKATIYYQKLEQIIPDFFTIEENKKKEVLIKKNRIKSDQYQAIQYYLKAIEANEYSIESYLRILEINPDNQTIIERLTNFLFTGEKLNIKIKHKLEQDDYLKLINLFIKNNNKHYVFILGKSYIERYPDSILEIKVISCILDVCVEEKKHLELIQFYKKYEHIIQKNNNISDINSNIYHYLGDLFFQQKEWQYAEKCYRAVIKLNPSHDWANLNLGRVLFESNKNQEASSCFKKALKTNPNLALGYFYSAEIFVKEEKWDDAIKFYEKAYNLNADINNLEEKIANSYKKYAYFANEQAFLWYQKAIDINPDNKNLYYNALEIKPNQTKLYLQLGKILEEQNIHEQANLCYKFALQHQLTNLTSFNELQSLEKDVNSSSSKILQQDTELNIFDPNKGKKFLDKGQAYLKHDQIDLAIVWLMIALKFNPKLAEAHFQLGNALASKADYKRAANHYRQALSLEPENCWYYNGWGDCLKAIWDLKSAIAAFDKAIKYKSDFEGFHNNKQQVLELQKHWQRVVDYSAQMQQQARGEADDGSLRILMITPYPTYPPNTGGAIRMFEQIKYFGSRHHLTVASFIFDDADYAIEDSLQDYCDFAVMVKLGAPIEPRKVNQQNQIYHWDTWNMRKILGELSKIDFDIVMFDFIFSAPYHHIFKDKITILNEHNIESRIIKQCTEAEKKDIAEIAENISAVGSFLNAEKEYRLLEAYENKTWSKFTLRTVVSEDDKQELESRCNAGKTIIVKNGIDTHSIVPVNNEKAQKMLYMGTMTYYPNIDAVIYFAEEILPIIRGKGDNLPFCIAGRDPSTEIQSLTDKYSYVEVVANPKKMTDVAQECSICIVPIRLGSGTRIKILHAMAMGLPVISTSLGCEGLEVIDGKNILIRDEPQDFAEAVLQLRQDSELWHELRNNGRKLMEEKYDWHSIFAQYEQELMEMI